MKTTTRSRILAWLLTVTMVMTLVPAAVFASESAVYTRITSADELTTGKYVMTVSTGYGTGVLENGWITAEAITAGDDSVTDPAATAVWDITVDGSTVKLTDSNGVSVAPKGNNNGIASGEYLWAVTCANGTFRFSGTGGDTVTLASNKGSENKFRGYKNTTVSGNPAGYPCDFTLYKLEQQAPARQSGLVTDLTALQSGDKVVVFNPANRKALSTTYNGYYNQGTDVTLTDGKLSGYTAADMWTLGVNEDGSYTFATAGGKKLSMGASYSSTPLDDVNQDWNITAAATEGCFYIQNVARASYLEWYSSKNNWSSYGTIGSNEDLFAQQLYLVVEEAEEPKDPTDPSDPIDPAAPIADGDQVVIYAPAYNKALSAEKTGYYNVGVDVTVADGVMTGYGESSTWTVTANDDGTYCFSNNGQNIGMADSYASMDLGAVNDKWELVDLGDGFYNVKNTARGNYMQWYTQYSNWRTYNSSNAATDDQFRLSFYVIPETREEGIVSELRDGDTVVVFNPANRKALSTTYNGYYNQGTDVTLTDGKLSGYTAADVWTVGINEDGSYTFATAGGKKLSMGASYSSTPLEDVNQDWNITAATTEGCFYIQNVARRSYLEWYSSKNNWSSYGTIGSNEDLFAQQFYLVTEPAGSDGAGLPNEGDQVVIYNESAKAVLGRQNDNTDSPAINPAGAFAEDGKAMVENGGLVFKVQKNGDYYRFCNDTFGYLCSNGTGNNAFYSLEASEDADWTLSVLGAGFSMESRTAKYNGKYSQYLEYYADSFKTYSMYNVTDYDIYTFQFYPCGNQGITAGVVNEPRVVFGAVHDAHVGAPYTLTFTVDAVFGVDTIQVSYPYSLTGGEYTVTVPVDQVVGESLTIQVSGTDTRGVAFSGSVSVAVKDEPVITDVTPAANSQTGEDLRPVISASLVNGGEAPAVTMTVNGEAANAVLAHGKITYTPTEDMAQGRTTVTVTVTRADGKSATKTWSFIVGQAQYQLYFGQLHSHTTYSDGSGSLESALDYISSLPESANVDFVAFTDHSNYFDTTSSANPEGALYDMSLASASSQNLWNAYTGAVDAFNARQSDVVALAGFEMTWSGGPGHMNTFNTPGIVSRNNSVLNNKTADAGMKAYYALLSRAEGADSISQFNHPGSTFGTFSDFSYWDAMIDTRVQLVEVGNGEGQIGAGGYYPSYEYYTMALDKGWHVAPTNNQDNHKGKWGNANDARDVVITDDFSEAGIYEAIRNYRVYATEDKNLEIGYTVNGLMMGSVIEEAPQELTLNVTVFDPDASDSVSKVEVIVNSGKVAHTWDNAAELAEGTLTATLEPNYSYYYIRVTEADGDLAVTAPVWVGETLRLGISSVECGTSTPVTNEEVEITTTLFNSEATDATVKSVTYTTGGSVVLGTDTTGYTIAANGTLALTWKYTPEIARLMSITAHVVMEQEGVEYQFSMDVELDVLDADALIYIGIDASHYNEYVAGNYKDSMGNFGELAASYSVRTVELKTSEDLIAACGNEKYKAIILTAPSRRLAAAQTDPKTYSEAELAALTAFNGRGGMVILAGWSDNYEKYSVIQEDPSVVHMAETQNRVLKALGSSLRIGDDATYDDVRSAADGVDKWRLYFSAYGESYLTEGVIFDEAHPYDKLYTERFSHYGGATVYAVDGQGNPTSMLPANVTPVVFAHDTTYSVDVDSDGLGGNIPKYTYTDGTQRLMAMASEQLEGKGMILVSGAAFMSNFEVQATVDNGAEKNYSNYRICENLLKNLNPPKITSIADVRAQTEAGYKYTIEGVVTSNASGYDKDTAFFDCIYIQDATGGICCFPVSGSYKIGDLVRITGTTEFYQGEPELQVTSIQVIGQAEPVVPTVISAAQLNDRSAEGRLVTLKGTVVSFEYANDLVQTIMVRDENGAVGRVFIDGYITTAQDVVNLEEGCLIEVTGLASYDDTFNAPDGPFPRIRVRNRADVICTSVHQHQWSEWMVVTDPTCTSDGLKTRTCSGCGETEEEVLPALGHDMATTVVKPSCTTMGYTEHRCSRCQYNYVSDMVDALGHQYTASVTEPTCVTDGYTTHTCSVCSHSYVDSIVSAKGHDYESVVTAPTHEKMGYTTHTCKNCSHSYVDSYTDALGHSYVSAVTKEPTCTEEGVMTFTCDCGESYTQAIPMTEHTYESVVTEPTCTNMGYTTHICSACQHSYTDGYEDALGHDCQETVVAPTCDSSGYTQHTCTRCDYSYISQIVDPKGHAYTLVNVLEATCENGGYTGDMVCSDCGHVDYEGKATEPLGHSWSQWTVTLEPNCFHEGQQERFCEVCQKTETETLPAASDNCFSRFFEDLDQNAWYHEAVDFVLRNGYMNGTGEAKFEPNVNLTRGQLVTILYRMEGSPQVSGHCVFMDVAQGRYDHDAILWAYKAGIAKGLSGTRFAPDQAVTREQMVVFLYRYAAAKGMDVEAEDVLDRYTDAEQLSTYAVDAMNWAVYNGLVNGMGGNLLAPGATAARVQFAQLVMKLHTIRN